MLSRFPWAVGSAMVDVLKLYRFCTGDHITMPNLSGMTVEALMNLREEVDETLLKRRAEIEAQLARMGAVVGRRRVGRTGGSVLRGRKVPPKISRFVRRNVGRPWRKTSLACCCDQRWKETRGFPD
jgi:hypothetical protein